MNIKKQNLIPLSVWKKNKREVFVDFTKNIVKWKNKKYSIKFVKEECGRTIPCVETGIKSYKEIKDLIVLANKEKEKLKRNEYIVNGDIYFVTGIGGMAIKAYKNYSKEAEFFNFLNSLEGQKLLEKICNSI